MIYFFVPLKYVMPTEFGCIDLECLGPCDLAVFWLKRVQQTRW